MQTIYKSADRVTTFLGSPPDAHLAVILLGKLVLRMKSYRPSEQWKPILGSYLRHQDVKGEPAPKEWVALKRLFSNPWFERAWVVQEVTMAANLYVLYGGIYIDWAMLMSVIRAFGPPDATVLRTLFTRVDEDHLGTMPNGLLNGIIMGAFRQRLRAGETMKLHEILRVCLTFHVTEPIDKIFALQGITEEASHPLLPINYRLKVPEVLMNTAGYFLQTRQSLQMLQLAGIGWKRDHKNIPSWVADWTMTRPPYMLSLSDFGDLPTAFTAATKIPPHIHHNQMKSSLEIKGLCFDEIDKLGDSIYYFDLIIHNNGPVDVRDLDRMWVSWFRQAEDIAQQKVPDPCHNGQSRLEAFW
jgi:Heterokaryon incompatibility protein (HET)